METHAGRILESYPMIRRQLTPEETRIYAAGMAARKRGETRPATRLPKDQYFIWLEGWKRIGRRPFTSSRVRKHHNTLQNGMHMVRTEVDNFDDALKLIEIQQRAAKISKTLTGKPATLTQAIALSNIARKQKMAREKRKTELLPHTTAVSELEKMVIDRLEAFSDMLIQATRQISHIEPISSKYPHINRRVLIDLIDKTCKILRKPMPDFTMDQRKPLQTLSRCQSCGVELHTKEERESKYCIHCAPPDERIKVTSQRRRALLLTKAGGDDEKT